MSHLLVFQIWFNITRNSHLHHYHKIVHFFKLSFILFLFCFNAICDGIVLKFVHAIRFQRFFCFPPHHPQTSISFFFFFYFAVLSWNEKLCRVSPLCVGVRRFFLALSLQRWYVVLLFLRVGGCYFQYLGKHWSWKLFPVNRQSSTVYMSLFLLLLLLLLLVEWSSVYFSRSGHFYFLCLVVHSFIDSLVVFFSSLFDYI